MTHSDVDRTQRAPWLPLIIIVLAQLQMGINVSALPVSLGPISDDLDAPATATATALLIYSLFVAALVMLGAKVGKLFGERLVFQVGVVAHGGSMAMMAISSDATTMNVALAVGFLIPLYVLLGIVVGQAFFWWSHRRVSNGEQPLLAMEVLDRSRRPVPPPSTSRRR